MAVSPDPRFVCSSDVESYFVDKDKGTPLSNGKVYFYVDNDRTTLKDVFQLTGSPPNYSFTALPNPMDLSAVGTYEYLNANIAVYYFPYEGTPDDSDSTVERYYVKVVSEDGVEQLTREAWPPNVGGGLQPTSSEGFRNFIPNGQFLTHTDIVGTTEPPVISVGGVDIQYIAQGGWSFRRTTGGASLFNNSFSSLSGTISGLNDYPRNAFNFICTSFSASDQVRDLCIEWPDINKFSSGDPVGTSPYTYFFGATSLDSNTSNFDLRLIRNYGTGGTPTAQIDTSVGTATIGPGYAYLTLNIANIPPATGTFGTNKDDYVLLALRGPASSWAIQFTDAVFFPGQQTLTSFPIQTNGDMLTRSVAGWIPTPNPDGSDLYLSPVLTPKGMVFDKSPVGKIYACAYTNGFTGSLANDTTEIICDGSAYKRTGYSPLGVPYYRLFDKLFDAAVTGICVYGTGIDFVTSFDFNLASNEILIQTNKAGPQTVTADGAAPTGFTFTTPITGNTTYGLYAYITAPQNVVTCIGTVAGSVTSATAGTSGFTVTQVQNSPASKQIFTVGVPALPSAGSYFTFDIAGGGPFYVWFTINGAGSDPAPGGTGILVPLISTYTSTEVASYVKCALLGAQLSRILTIAASGMSAGDFFTFHSNGETYIVWYKIDGVGSAPALAGNPIQITIASSDSAASVAEETAGTLNAYQFAVPNLKGVILKGMNVGASNIPGDPGFNDRFTLEGLFNTPGGVGSYQASTLLQHLHAYVEADDVTEQGAVTIGDAYAEDNGGTGSLPLIPNTTQSTGYAGGAESTPFNMYVNYVIKY